MTNRVRAHISGFMHGSAAGKIARLCFIVLFAAMSVFHFPVMAFGGDPHAPASHAAAPQHHHGGHADHATPAGAAKCDGFACFLAVEPGVITSRPLHAVLFGILSIAATDFRLAADARPDPPPPRLQS